MLKIVWLRLLWIYKLILVVLNILIPPIHEYGRLFHFWSLFFTSLITILQFSFFLFNFISDDIYTVDQGWKGGGSSDSRGDGCLYIFSLLPICVGEEHIRGEATSSLPTAARIFCKIQLEQCIYSAMVGLCWGTQTAVFTFYVILNFYYSLPASALVCQLACINILHWSEIIQPSVTSAPSLIHRMELLRCLPKWESSNPTSELKHAP